MTERELERELTAAMRRVDAPAGFLGGVMEAAEGERRAGFAGTVLTFPQRYRWIGGVAASLLLAGVLFGGVEHRRAADRERADRDFARSMAITDRAMKHALREIQQAGISLE